MVAEIPAVLHIPIGEVVRKWRQFRGLSLTEFARKAQLSKGYVSELERNIIRDPKPQQLAKLAGGLEIEVWDLLMRRMPSKAESSESVGTELRRRSSGAFPSPPMDSQPPMSDPTMSSAHGKTLGQTIDVILAAERLSREEQKIMSEVLVPHVLQLARMIKLAKEVAQNEEKT